MKTTTTKTAATKTAAKARETELRRSLVAGLDHHDLYILARAAQGFAASLDVTDRVYPDPDMRADAARLRELGELMLEANRARDWLQTKGEETP